MKKILVYAFMAIFLSVIPLLAFASIYFVENPIFIEEGVMNFWAMFFAIGTFFVSIISLVLIIRLSAKH